jgi:hypothetical protein
MTVDGKTYDRAATVLRDPRISANDVDLRAQYDLAKQIVALETQVKTARSRAQRVDASKLSAERAHELKVEIVGENPPDNPDDSVGSYSHDFTSFLYLEGALDYLESAVESADAPPTPDMRSALVKLDAIYRATLARLEKMER